MKPPVFGSFDEITHYTPIMWPVHKATPKKRTERSIT